MLIGHGSWLNVSTTSPARSAMANQVSEARSLFIMIDATTPSWRSPPSLQEIHELFLALPRFSSCLKLCYRNL
jgi:hypothetical protein